MGRKRKVVEVVEGEGSQEQQPKGPYFSWTEQLDALLIQCMQELVQKHQVENGNFKNGSFTELENLVHQKAPACGVKVEPNIRSRHKKLKRDFMAVHLLCSKSGQGWDESTCTPYLDDDVFEDLLKVHPNIKNLNKKPFPFYNELAEVFGKGGTAVGRCTGGISDGPPSPESVMDLEGFDSPIDLDSQRTTEIMDDLINEAASNKCAKKKAKKFEINTDEAIVNVSSQLGELKPIIFKAVEALGSIIGDRDGENSKQAALIKEIGKIGGLTRDQVIDAAMALVDNEPKTRLFYALESEEDRCYFIRSLLR
ncbi:unnamed protein product [Linum trigynum]|uniref:Myb/SANT-like domain-containing protein n=1 Tax=Linum trigynum TaxID=586398 RepID=A0AAV2GQ61_9ROSI